MRLMAMAGGALAACLGAFALAASCHASGAARPHHGPYAVGFRRLHLYDASRRRRLLTEIRYPAAGRPGGLQVADGPAVAYVEGHVAFSRVR